MFRYIEYLRSAGKPLGEYVQGRFFYGIKTGLNEAFVVDRATRDRLVAEHTSSTQVLKPFLRGRDVKRWRCEPEDLWLIFTRRGCDIKEYPAILEHLKQFKKQLMPGVPGGRKPGSYEWYEIQDNVAYWQEFETTKIAYPDIYEHQTFAWDDRGYYLGNTCYFIPTDQKWFVALLNSPLVEWFYGNIANRIRGGYLRAFSQFMQQVPIPCATPDQQRWCERLAEALIWLHNPGVTGERAPLSPMTAYFEQWINGLVYELFLADDLHARHLRLFDETAKLAPPDLSKLTERDKLSRLHEMFTRAYDLNAPLRAMLFSLTSLEPVRIIEGGSQPTA